MELPFASVPMRAEGRGWKYLAEVKFWPMMAEPTTWPLTA
jgi:hypothetical protein